LLVVAHTWLEGLGGRRSAPAPSIARKRGAAIPDGAAEEEVPIESPILIVLVAPALASPNDARPANDPTRGSFSL
jgi:hypothetical protein